MTSPTPVRAIKTRARSRSAQMAARRAVEAPKPLDSPTPAPTAVATAVRPPAKTTALPPPTIGKAEKQLLVSFLVTAAIAFTFMVLIPVVLRLVRNF